MSGPPAERTRAGAKIAGIATSREGRRGWTPRTDWDGRVRTWSDDWRFDRRRTSRLIATRVAERAVLELSADGTVGAGRSCSQSELQRAGNQRERDRPSGRVTIAIVSPASSERPSRGRRRLAFRVRRPGAKARGRRWPTATAAMNRPARSRRLFDAYQHHLRAAGTAADRSRSTAAVRHAPEAAAGNAARTTQERNQLMRTCSSSRVRAPAAGTTRRVKERLTALHELDDRTATEMRKAYDALDEVLDVRQQARFRVFEETHRAPQDRPADARASRTARPAAQRRAERPFALRPCIAAVTALEWRMQRF